MVLADTSVWIDHFRRGHAGLAASLSEGLVLMHPFISGELACGNLKNRSRILTDLSALPPAKQATHEEALQCLDQRKLYGRGLGWIDVHLLASAMLSECRFWTRIGDWPRLRPNSASVDRVTPACRQPGQKASSSCTPPHEPNSTSAIDCENLPCAGAILV